MKRKEIVLIVVILLVFLVILGVVAFYFLQKPKVVFSEGPVSVEVNTEVQYQMPKVMYHGKDISNSVRVIKGIDTSKLGLYEVQYEFQYLFWKETYTQIYEVVDTTGPQIVLNGGEFIKQSYTVAYEEPGYTANDNYDGDLTSKVIVQKIPVNTMQDTYRYSCIDTSGNQTIVERTVQRIDDVPPVITLNSESDIIMLRQGEKFEDKGATATDEIDGDLSKQIQTRGEVDTSTPGDYVITYRVTDKSGNTAEKSLTVTVLSRQTSDTGNTNAGTSGTIYLTFDDGPSKDITPKLLDVLQQKNVKATFFILNYDTSKEYLVKRIVNEGHSIAIHGYSHDYQKIYASEEAYMENIESMRQKIYATTGINTYLTRFPGGSSNEVSSFNPGIMTRLTRLVVGKGYHYFDWNVSSGDAGDTTSKEGVFQNVTTALRKNRANVVLMHDKAGNTYTLDAIADIIDYGKQNGYSFEKITMSTPMVTHHVAN